MFYRALTLSAAVLGGAGASQFPEYSQQYLQRLSGAVDELTIITTAFDATATAAGLSREDALAELQGTSFLAGHRNDMTNTFARYEKLSADLMALEDASPFTRALQAWRMTDSDVAHKAWGDFEPALPVTTEGATFAGIGALFGWLTLAGLWALMARLFRTLFKRKPVLVTESQAPPIDAARQSLRDQVRHRR